MLAANYAPGDVVVFHSTDRRTGLWDGQERRLAGVDYECQRGLLNGGENRSLRWRLGEIVGRRCSGEVYEAEEIEPLVKAVLEYLVLCSQTPRSPA